MMMYWILCLGLLAGAVSASAEQDVQRDVQMGQPRNTTLLQQFPSIVQIEFYLFWSSMEWLQECTGSLLTSRILLTAATCTSGWTYEPRFRRIRAGSSYRNSGGFISYVQDRVNSPGWGTAYTSDISLIRTLSALTFSPVVQQASIPTPGSWIPNGLQLNQLGWGRIRQQQLTNQAVITAPISSCGRRDGNFSSVLNATADILCGSPLGAAISNYDVGAPWIFGGVTLGIVSGVNTLEVYKGLISADVAKFTEWILHTARTWW